MNTIYGYAKVSTPTQNLARQVDNLRAFDPKIVIYEEAYTGRRIQGRQQLARLLRRVKEGDTIVFDSVSRMSRDADEGYALYESLFDKGVELVFLKERHCDTKLLRDRASEWIAIEASTVRKSVDAFLGELNGAINRLLLAIARENIRLAFEQSQKEVDDLRERTREGLRMAKVEGKQVGGVKGARYNVKKKGPAKERIKKLSNRYGGPLTAEETWRVCGISRGTYYSYCREIDSELAHEAARSEDNLKRTLA